MFSLIVCGSLEKSEWGTVTWGKPDENVLQCIE